MINTGVITVETAIKPVKGDNGVDMESHAIKFDFPIEHEVLAKAMANKIWHFGDYYVAEGKEDGGKFMVAIAKVVQKGSL